MRLSEIIIRRKIRRIIQEAVGGVPTSTATGRSTYTAALVSGKTGDLSFSEKVTRIVLGAIGLRVLWGIAERALDPSKTTPDEKKKLTMHATVCGDSQANGSLGAAVAAQLEKKGYTVTRVGDDGAQPSVVLRQVQAAAKDSVLVVAIFGGNSPSPGDAASNLTKMYDACEKSGAAFMAIGPPPPTKILDTQQASTVFSTTIKDPDHWLKLPASANKSPDFRRAVSDAMQAAKSGSEDINVWGIASNMSYPGDYEDQPDGIHCVNGADEVARRALEGLRIDEATTEIKKTIEDAQRKESGAVGRVGKPDEVKPGQLNLQKFKDGIMGPESRGSADPYKAENKPQLPGYCGAYGKYQILAYDWTEDLIRFLKDTGHPLNKNGKFDSVSKRDCKSSDSAKIRLYYELWQGFLGDSNLQEDYMDMFTRRTAAEALSWYDGSRGDGSDMSKLDFAQICAAVHFGGGPSMQKLKVGGLGASPGGNNSTYAAYIKEFNKYYYT